MSPINPTVLYDLQYYRPGAAELRPFNYNQRARFIFLYLFAYKGKETSAALNAGKEMRDLFDEALECDVSPALKAVEKKA